MKTNENDLIYSNQSQVKSCQVSRFTFREAIAKARQQVNIECFDEKDRDFANEIIMNMAEIFMLWDESPVRIGRDQLDGYIVKQVFEQIREEHVQLVIENFSKIDYAVKYKKSYIRTALYNAVFEYEANYKNLVRSTK